MRGVGGFITSSVVAADPARGIGPDAVATTDAKPSRCRVTAGRSWPRRLSAAEQGSDAAQARPAAVYAGRGQRPARPEGPRVRHPVRGPRPRTVGRRPALRTHPPAVWRYAGVEHDLHWRPGACKRGPQVPPGTRRFRSSEPLPDTPLPSCARPRPSTDGSGATGVCEDRQRNGKCEAPVTSRPVEVRSQTDGGLPICHT